MKEISKEKRIKTELERICVFFEEIAENQRAIVAPLLQNAAFMKVTLEDLQETINTEGATDRYMNGSNQYGVKQSATMQSYNALIKNFTTVIKTLSVLLPPEKKAAVNPQFARIKTAEELEAERREREEEAEYWAEEFRKLKAGEAGLEEDYEETEKQRKRNEEIAEAAERQRRQRKEKK